MSFDETYDEMLHDEFRSRGAGHGTHAAPETAREPVPETSPETAPETAAAGQRGLSRFRTAGLVGAGGLACAAVGAFLGGLGGYFTVNPAAAHTVASSSVSGPSLAAAVNQAYRSQPATNGTAAFTAASFSGPSGSAADGITPFGSLTAALPGNPAGPTFLLADPGTGGGNGASVGSTGGGSGEGAGSGCSTTQSDLGLSCILDNITSVLGNLGSLQGTNPTALLGVLGPTLSGVVADVSGTLSNLGSLLPASSLPLPTSGFPSTGLAGLVPGSTSSPTVLGGSSRTGSGLAPGSTAGAATPGATKGSAAPSLPSLPLPAGGSVPSLPVTTPTGSVPAPPTVGLPGVPTGGGSTTITVPLPTLPVSVPPISIGGISIGGSGLGLTLP